MAHFRSSGGMPSGPAAQPLRRFIKMARVIKSKVGMFVKTSGFGVAMVASESIAEDANLEGGSALPRSVSASARVYFLHGSHAVMVGTWEAPSPVRNMIAENKQPKLLVCMLCSASSASSFRYTSWFAFALLR